MTYLRSLEGFTPPERHLPDAAVFDRARIEENVAPVDAGLTVIEPVFTLSPTYSDPEQPPTYNFTTTGALLAEGWYRVVWLGVDGVEQPTDWLQLRNLSPYAPSVGDVASILRARLVELGGERVDTFTDQTEPTSQAVAQAIALHTPLIFMRLGDLSTLTCTTGDELRAAARSIAAQRVAMEVELSFRPEEVGESAAAATDQRRALLDDDLEALVAAIEACRASGPEDPDPGSTGRADAAWSFPKVPYLNW